ncbi:hypothetical protein IJX73_02070 [bacterium]|nr:hypothetical protein [bacterium]MBQ9149695.1 hypothetical protein [bacterium]
MINFSGILGVRGNSNTKYINTNNIEKIEDVKGKAKVIFVSGSVDTFECSANKLANKICEMESASTDWAELDDDTVERSPFL